MKYRITVFNSKPSIKDDGVKIVISIPYLSRFLQRRQNSVKFFGERHEFLNQMAQFQGRVTVFRHVCKNHEKRQLSPSCLQLCLPVLREQLGCQWTYVCKIKCFILCVCARACVCVCVCVTYAHHVRICRHNTDVCTDTHG